MKGAPTIVGQSHQQFRAYPTHRLVRKEALLKELCAPCGRFAPVVSWEQKMDARISSLLGVFDAWGEDSYRITNGLPANWQALASYLHQHGLTQSNTIEFRPLANDLPKVYGAYLQTAESNEHSDGRAVEPRGFGAATSPEEAMSKAVGELLERHFLSSYRESDLLYGSYADMKRSGHAALDPQSLNGFLPWQKEIFPRYERGSDRPHRWVKAKLYPNGSSALVPAQLVYWSYRFDYEHGEPLLAETNTSGCAGHFTFEEALLSSLLELIERDGFMIYWLNSLTPRVIDQTTITDSACKELLLTLRRHQLECYLLNTTTDIGVPSCTCVLVDRTGALPMVAFGGGVGFELRDILSQAIGEALAVLSASREHETVTISDDYKPFTDTQMNRHERLYVWRGEKMLERLNFFLSGAPQPFEGFMGNATDYTNTHTRLAKVVGRLNSLGEGYEIYHHEVKSSILSELGYRVVRAIVPKLVQLYLAETHAPLDSSRLRTVPEKIGYAPAEKYNPWPHPFP